MSKLTYKDLLEKAKPFDLIVFRGEDFISSTISHVEKKAFGTGEWTHVGVIITKDVLDFKNAKRGKLYVWESTMSGGISGDNVLDEETNKGKFGVQIRDFEKVIQSYLRTGKSRIGWCPLKNNPLVKKSNETIDDFVNRIFKIKNCVTEFYKAHKDSPYDNKVLPLFKTIFPCFGKLPLIHKLFKSKNKLFCSEMVTLLYQHLNLVDISIDPETIAPVELIGSSSHINLFDKDTIVDIVASTSADLV